MYTLEGCSSSSKNPPNPSHTGSVPAAGNSYRVTLQGNKLAVAGGGTGMLLYDISSPWAPVQTALVSLTSKHNYLTDDLAFTSADGISFDIHNISDINAPVLLANAHADRFSQYSISQNDLLYILEYDLYWSGPETVTYLRIVDVSDPSAPSTVSEIALAVGGPGPECMTMIDNYMYTFLNGTDTCLMIVDVANPDTMEIVSQHLLSGTNPFDVNRWGHFIFVSYENPTMVEMLDIANPLSPASVDFIQFPTRPWEITTVGNKLLTASEAGFYVHEINAPRVCGDIDSNGGDPNVSDLTFLVAHLFRGGDEPIIPETADVDGNGTIDVSDITYLVDYLFKSGPPLNCIL